MQVAAAIVVLAVTGLSQSAAADHPTAHFDYQRKDGAEQCPNEQTVRDGVAARLGYDPFDAESPRQIRSTIRPKTEGSGYLARIEVRRTNSSDRGVRKLQTNDANCGGLAEALVFTVSVVIDPGSMGRGSDRPGTGRRAVMAAVLRVHDALGRAESAQSRARAQNQNERDDRKRRPQSDEPDRSPIDFRASVGGGVAAGTAPSASPMVRLELELAKPRWAVRAVGRADGATRTDLEAGTVVGSFTGAGLDVCGRLPPAFGCASFTAGQLRLSGADVRDPQAVGRLYAATGAGLGLDIPFAEHFAARLQGRMYATLLPTRVFIGEQPVWTTPDLSGSLAASLLVDF